MYGVPIMSETASVHDISKARERRQGYNLEDGYTKINNQILDDLMAASLTAAQFKIVLAVIRKTYGYNKKSDKISGSQLAGMVDLSKPKVAKALSALVRANVIKRPSQRSNLTFNKYRNEWDLDALRDCRNGQSQARDCRNGQSKIAEMGNQQKTISKVTTISNDIVVVDDKSPTVWQKPSFTIIPKKKPNPKKPPLPNCPHEKILELWEKHFPAKPQPVSLDAIKTNLATRWKRGFTLRHRKTNELLYTDLETGLIWWDRFFDYCAKQELLNESKWFCFHWVIKLSNFEKVIAGNYEND